MKFLNKYMVDGAIVGALIAVIVAVVSSVNVINYTNSLNDNFRITYEKDIMGQNHIQNARINLIYIHSEIKNLFLIENEERNRQIIRIKKYEAVFIEYLSKSRPLFYSQKAKDIFEKVNNSYKDYFSSIDNIILLFNKNQRDNARKLTLNQMKDSYDALDDLLYQLEQVKLGNNLAAYKKTLFQQRVTIVVSILILLATIIIRIKAFMDSRKMTLKKDK